MEHAFLRHPVRSIQASRKLAKGEIAVALPQSDINYLTERGKQFSVVEEANMTCVVFTGHLLPAGLDRGHADLLIRLSSGFPDIPPDMWWFDPGVHYADGRIIQCTDSVETHLGRSWQRWSRHLPAGQWKLGTDSLESFLALIYSELERYTEERVQ